MDKITNNNEAKEMEIRLYDLNKTIMAQMPVLDEEVVIEELVKYFEKYDRVPVYHMILSAEERDYTVIEFNNEISKETIAKAVAEIAEVLESRGPVKSIEVNEDGSMDIWINDKFYKIFDYSWGVITV